MSRPTGFPPKVRRLIMERAGIEGDWVRDEVSGMWVHVEDAQLHHRIPRGSGGSKRPEVNQSANGLVLSPTTHYRVEVNRRDALKKGWLISKLSVELPFSVPVLLHHGWVVLDNQGGWERTEEAA
jgi:5-methylcytosine-specific restriction protein A